MCAMMQGTGIVYHMCVSTRIYVCRVRMRYENRHFAIMVYSPVHSPFFETIELIEV